MSVIDVESLLIEASPEAPCGEDLEYDPAFQEMERAAQGKPEQQFGDTIVPAEEPEWKDVAAKAKDVLSRSKDLRAAVHLTSAALRLDGLAGFESGLLLVHGLLSRYWDGLHPMLDPDDGNDPTLRINTIVTLNDADTTLLALKEAPLVESKALGRFGLRHIEIASGHAPRPEGDHAEMPTIEAAFLDCELEALQATAASIQNAKETAEAIDQYLTTTLGASQAPDLSALPVTLAALKEVVDAQLVRRGVGEEVEGEEGSGGDDSAGGGGKSLSGEIRNPEDVVRALDKIIDYYNRKEPSSPIPILMMRAKRLVSKTFMEILADLAPGGVSEAETIRGVDTDSSSGY